ncbi:phosphoglycolate phosphatase-like HAD superfamily hydrolase [Arthrobacter sp. V4I6]|nr:phosphoglycolate phosphatase-like HAD superfamily hydrolase [Arthrobacter sp. V4I6]
MDTSEAGSGVLARGLGVVRGVLFDIDDTLVDLEFAMTAALRDVSEHLLPELDQSGWEKFGRIFTRETTHFYDRYLAGELSFNEQRLLRGRAALGHFGVELDEGEQAHHWVSSYASRQHGYIRAFDDVPPLLDALDAAGIPYGAVSNNVHDYQRVKLDAAGLERIGVLVGTDTLGVPKPDPAIYLEGRPPARNRGGRNAVRRRQPAGRRGGLDGGRTAGRLAEPRRGAGSGLHRARSRLAAGASRKARAAPAGVKWATFGPNRRGRFVRGETLG